MKSAQICNNWACWIATHIKFIMSEERELDQTQGNVSQLGKHWGCTGEEGNIRIRELLGKMGGIIC